MKKLSIIAMVFLLSASILTGCRGPEPGTTGATENNPTTSTVRPQPTITMPGTSGTTPGTSNSTGSLGRMGPHA